MKLTNRYTTNKNYYSYKNNFLSVFKKVKFIQYFAVKIEQMDDADFVNRWIKKRVYSSAQKQREVELQFLFAYLFVDAYKRNYPVYYLSSKFIDLIKNTKLPIGYDLSNQYFIQNAIFLLPKQEHDLFIYKGRRLQWIGFCSEPNNCLTSSDTIICDYVFGGFENSILTPIIFPFFSEASQALSSAIDQDRFNIVRLLVHVFLYMATYQEKAYGLDESNIVSDHTGQVVKGFGQKERLKTPLTIGLQEEKYYRSQISQANPNLQGIKKATHWRRGHWRKVNEDKLTWIRPMLINAC